MSGELKIVPITVADLVTIIEHVTPECAQVFVVKRPAVEIPSGKTIMDLPVTIRLEAP